MVYDDEAGAQYLYGGVDRMRANVAVSQAAYAEARDRAARDRGMAVAGCRPPRPSGRRGGSRRVEMSVD